MTPTEIHAEIDYILSKGGEIQFCTSRKTLVACTHAEGHEGPHGTVSIDNRILSWAR